MELRAPEHRDYDTPSLQAAATRHAAVCHVRRIVGVGMGLPCHDGEVESVVMEDDAVLVLGVRGRARNAQAQRNVPKRRSHHRVPRVLQGWLLRHEELVGLLGSALDFFEEGHHRGAHSSTG